MECIVCKKEGMIDTSTGVYCRRCFSRRIEKRIRKYARVSKLIDPKLPIICRDEVTHHIVKSMFKGARIDIRMHNKGVKGQIIGSWTLDDEVTEFLSSVIHDRKMKRREASLLVAATDEEIMEYAAFNGLKFLPKKKEEPVQLLIDTMARKYKETKYALLKSSKEIQKILR